VSADAGARPPGRRPQKGVTPETLRGASPFGVRGATLLALCLAGVWAYLALALNLSDLLPGDGGLALAGKFFSRAFSPALHSEARFVPAGSPPLLALAFRAALETLWIAAAAMGLALIFGAVLGFFASTTWWSDEGARRDPRSGRIRLFWRGVAPGIFLAVRALIAVMRSVHELIWAVLFLTAIGLNNLAAVFAIAIPYAGVLAKVFSEMIDEAPRAGARALRATGATELQVFYFGLLPGALPDIVAYSFYRFECALRSSAILGFFGFPTLGLYIRQSFNSTNYGEVWTYLYASIALVLVFEFWSGGVRRHLQRGPGSVAGRT